MLFAETDLTSEDIDNYYINCNMYDSVSDIKKDVYNESNEIYFGALDPYITKESSIIDVGCGNGSFLRYLKDKGYERLFGVDPAESSVRKLEKYGIKGIVGSIYDKVPDWLRGKFDVVISTGVLEHLLLPAAGLKNLVCLLKKTGAIYVSVPNAEGFKDYLREVPNYFNQEHINYFTSGSLDLLCARSGLERCSSDADCYHVVCSSSPEVVISAVYRPAQDMKEMVKYDKSGIESVKIYFNKIEKKQLQQKEAIKKLLKESATLVVWGTGGFAASLLCDMPELAEKVSCFVDNDCNKQKETFFGKRVISPDCLKNYPTAAIFICVMLSGDSVVKQIKSMDLPNKVFLVTDNC